MRDVVASRDVGLRLALGKALERFFPRIRFSEHIDGDGAIIFEHACKLADLGGIISKRRDLPCARRIPLVVAKVDRLTRSVSFLSRLLDAGVDVRFADLPAIEGATGKFILQQMVAVAELEAGMISARTKAALAAAKKRGVKLGGWRGHVFTAREHKASAASRRRQALQRAADLAPVVKELQASGVVSLMAIAAGLNERSIPTARGGQWSATQVMRLLADLG
jgi:hypothetical protein